MTVFDESQQDRDIELAEYSGRSLAEIQSLRITDPAGIRIYDPSLPDPDPADLNDLYKSYRFLDSVHYLRALSYYTVVRRKSYISRLEEALDGFDGTRVLDFGCGVGSHAIYCAQKGAQVTTIDVDGPLYDYAKSRFYLRRLPFMAKRIGAELKPGSFDAAICLDVLEHVADPAREIRRIAKSLCPGGKLVLEVSTMIKPASGHFARSIDRWKSEGVQALKDLLLPIGGGLYEAP